MSNPILELLSKDLLPNKSMKATAWAIGILIPVAIYLPDRLQSIGIELKEEYKLTVRIISFLLVVALGLLALLCQLALWHRSKRIDRSEFVEHDGAYLKKKKEGGLFKCVYCGSCFCSTASETNQFTQKYKCKCGWVSQFNVDDFDNQFPELEEQHGA